MINAEPGGLQSVRFREKGSLRMTFEINTKGAHGAYTHLAEGANRMAIRLIQELQIIEQIRPTDLPRKIEDHLQRPEVRATIDSIMGPGAADIMLVPTLNVGVIRGCLKVNMIPEKCVFEADVRLPIGLKAETVLHHIRSILTNFPEVELRFQEAASNPASFCDAAHPIAEVMADVAESVTGRRPVAIPGLGATDCKFWRYKGIPAYVYGVSPRSMGTKNEHVEIDDFLSIVKVHTVAAWEYLQGTATKN
jgi:acetylornithine deacetylase/succinyl-diaminopimelate desuccinylase-like protein